MHPSSRARKAAGLLNLKGHRVVGGMRASIYNAMPIEGVRELVSYLQDLRDSARVNRRSGMVA